MHRGRPSTSFPLERRHLPTELRPKLYRAAWEAAGRPAKGPFDDAGRLQALSPATRLTYAASFGA
jgi:hypothetical protein